MEFEQVVRTRRTIRSFSEAPVPDEVVRQLIDCAVQAPSSMDGQPWYFIVVRDQGTKQRLAAIKDKHCPPEKRRFPAGFLTRAPLLIVTCVDQAKSFDRGIENGVLATAHLLLAAANYGLTSVYMSAHKTGSPEVADDIRAALAIPADIDPVTLVPLGYPAEAPAPKTIKPVAEVMFREAFGRR